MIRRGSAKEDRWAQALYLKNEPSAKVDPSDFLSAIRKAGCKRQDRRKDR